LTSEITTALTLLSLSSLSLTLSALTAGRLPGIICRHIPLTTALHDVSKSTTTHWAAASAAHKKHTSAAISSATAHLT